MHEPPEVFVPLRDRPKRRDWRLALTRLWCVLAVFCGWMVLTSGDRGPLHFRGAIFTLAGFYFVWQLAAWITRPALPD